MSEISSLLERYLGPPITSGEELKYRCPFHTDSSPSFYVNAESGVSFCHACNKGRSFLTLLRDLGAEHTLLTAVAGFILPPRKTERRLSEVKMTPLPEELLGVFYACPKELLDAGFDKALLRDHEVGFDSVHGCPVYPIRDHLGRLIAISGRFEHSYMVYGPKQLSHFLENPPTHEIKKSWFLWNLNNVYPGFYHGLSNGPVVITEGFKACLWCIQHGFPNTVALMGSYLSFEQAQMLLTLGSDLVLFLDQDKAGENGIKRAIDVLGEARLVCIAQYPRDGKLQPDALTPAEVKMAIETSTPSYRRT